MLDPPISQADIDAGTVFLRRDGREVQIAGYSNDGPFDHWPWVANEVDCELCCYAGDGQRYNNKNPQTDLIARKPKESEMSQVVVEDKRIRPLESPIVSFGKLKDESVFVRKVGPQVVCVKFGGNRLSFNGTYVAVYSTDDLCQCIPRPDLRLRLVLETI